MHPMAIDRRAFLAGAGGLLASGLAAQGAPAETRAADEPLFAAARRSPDGAFSAAIFRPDGTDVNAVALPARGHDVTVCPVTRTCVAFARRPGNFAVAFRRDKGWKPIRFTTPPDRHFYGHGVFSRDGRILFATENDFEAGRGCIGLYDATAGFRRIGEMESHGVGPHDIALMKDGRTLVIANGGIETHPAIGGGRTQLNRATMSPSLAYVDTITGDLVERHELPEGLRQLSLRHLDVGAGGMVVIGGQFKGDVTAGTPLILRHRLGGLPKTVELAADLSPRLRGYISSVAVDASGEIAALTGSRGGIVLFIDVATGRVLGERSLVDVSGVAPSVGGFLLTTGKGEIASGASPSQGATMTSSTHWQWDNHAVLVS
jgi:hypothetical protein